MELWVDKFGIELDRWLFESSMLRSFGNICIISAGSDPEILQAQAKRHMRKTRKKTKIKKKKKRDTEKDKERKKKREKQKQSEKESQR